MGEYAELPCAHAQGYVSRVGPALAAGRCVPNAIAATAAVKLQPYA